METHVAIIGAYGSAGVAVADLLADDSDIELTLIDDGDPGGGLCILRGCMPSKEVLSAAEHRFVASHDDRLSGGLPDVDLDSVVERKNEHTANFAAHRRAAVERLANEEGVTFVHGTAQFVDDDRLAVGDRTIAPDYVVIATGSTVNVPEIPGIDDVEVLTSADVLDRTAFGDSGVVMGFGYIGLELVPYLSEAAGMDLTVVEHDARPLDGGDDPFGDALLEYYREAFDIEVLTRSHEKRIESTGGGASGSTSITTARKRQSRPISCSRSPADGPRLIGWDSKRRRSTPVPGGLPTRCRPATTSGYSSPAMPTARSQSSTWRKNRGSRRPKTSRAIAMANRSSSTRIPTTTSSFRGWECYPSRVSVIPPNLPRTPGSTTSSSPAKPNGTACSKRSTSPKDLPASSSARMGPFSGIRDSTTTPT